MRRFTILNLMGLVLALALALAALRGANDSWAGGLLMAVPLLFGLALIGARCGKERSRAGRLGFAVLGGVYFALAFLGLSEGHLAKLPTSKLLRYVHERVAGQRTFSVVFTGTSPSLATATTTTPGGPAKLAVTQPPDTVNFTASSSGGSTVTAVFDRVGMADVSPPNRWRAMLPGAADYGAFQAVGHCLVALLAGMLGAVVAWRFERGRQTSTDDRS